MNQDRYDVIIIGSGFGGAAAAYSLAKTGLNTLLLEKGNWVKRDETAWNAKDIFINKRYKSYAPVYVNQNNNGTQEVYFNEVVGGNSIFFGGVALRFRETDFERWPISYMDLEPYYSEAERLLEVSGEPGLDPFEPYRSSDYFYNDLPMSEPSRRIFSASRALGFKPFKLPLAINFRNNSKTLCIKCNTCDGFPCKIKAKNDVTTTLLKRAQEYKLKITTGSIVKNISDENGTIESVTVVDKQTGKKYRYSSKLVILSAGALQSPGILLRSNLDKYPHREFIGKYLMRHCSAVVSGIFPFKTNPDKVFHKHVGITNFYEDFRNETNTSVGMIQDVYMPERETVKYYCPKGIKTLAAFFAGNIQNLMCIGEDDPVKSNAVSLSGIRDSFGIETIKIDHDFTKNDYKRRKYLIGKAKIILRKTGSIFSFSHGIDEHIPPAFAHATGTVRFGKSPETSVLDKNCKFFGIKNLFVLDGSFMPSSGGVNPSLTITANSLRVSDHIVKNFDAFQ